MCVQPGEKLSSAVQGPYCSEGSACAHRRDRAREEGGGRRRIRTAAHREGDPATFAYKALSHQEYKEFASKAIHHMECVQIVVI